MVNRTSYPRLHLYSAIAFVMAGIFFLADDAGSSDPMGHVLVGTGLLAAALLQFLAWRKKSGSPKDG